MRKRTRSEAGTRRVAGCVGRAILGAGVSTAGATVAGYLGDAGRLTGRDEASSGDDSKLVGKRHGNLVIDSWLDSRRQLVGWDEAVSGGETGIVSRRANGTRVVVARQARQGQLLVAGGLGAGWTVAGQVSD